MKNEHRFNARKKPAGRRYGTLATGKPNTHRVPHDKEKGSKTSRPLRMPTGEKHWTAVFSGREKINQLFRRAGVNLNL
jgi:hypothetical protein